MRHTLGLFGHLSDWQVADRRTDRVDPRPPRLAVGSPRFGRRERR